MSPFGKTVWVVFGLLMFAFGAIYIFDPSAPVDWRSTSVTGFAVFAWAIASIINAIEHLALKGVSHDQSE